MSLDIFGHTKGLDFLLAKDGGHHSVWGEPLLVGEILQVAGLQVGPQPLYYLRSGQLLVLLGVYNSGQFGGQGHRFGQTIHFLLGFLTSHFLGLRVGLLSNSKILYFEEFRHSYYVQPNQKLSHSKHMIERRQYNLKSLFHCFLVHF